MLSYRGIMQLPSVNMILGVLLLCALPSKSRAASRCCASARSFTVVVLMRDESGYMMLLPFHQQRKPPNPEQTQKRHRGIPLSQPRRHPLSSGVETENRGLLAVYSRLRTKAQDPFFLVAPALGCVFLLSALDQA